MTTKTTECNHQPDGSLNRSICSFVSDLNIKLSYDCPTVPHEDCIKLEYPFCDAIEVSCDFILIPSQGNFLKDFNNRVGLHLGIANKDGQILDYDKAGLIYGAQTSPRWCQCLKLDIFDHLLCEHDKSKLQTIWEDTVEHFVKSKNLKWTKNSYNDDSNNCFDFALDFARCFLKSLDKQETSKSVSELLRNTHNKTLFCQQFVVPRTHSAAKYISLYRKLNAGIEYIDRQQLSSLQRENPIE